MYLVTLRIEDVPVIVHSTFERIADAKIVKERNAIPSFEFTLYPKSRAYDAITHYTTTVTCQRMSDGAMEFEGRIISAVPSMDSDGSVCKVVTCEGLEGYLCDSEQPYTEERTWEGDTERTGLQEFVDYVLENHNARVEPEKRVYRGIVDVPTFKTTDNVTKGTNFERTLDLFQEKIVKVFGGEWRVRRGDDGLLYLDYRDMLGTVRKTPIRVGHNMESASREPDPERLITRLYPRGAKLKRTEKDEDGAEREVETEERLGIAEVNGGKPYIDDEKAMADFGIIEGHADWDDVTDPLNLMTKAEAWLEDNNAFPVSTEVSALDLSLIGIDPDSFAIYDWYPCYNDLIDLDEKLEIVKQTIDINDPTASSFVLGESTQTQSNKIAALEGLAGEVEIVKSQSHTTVINLENSIRYTMAAIQVAEDKIVSTVGEQIVQTTERIDGEITVIESRVSTIEQTATQIILDVSVLEQSQREMSSQIALMPDQIISTVTEGYEAYVDGEIRTVNTAISEVVQKADSIESTVQGLQAAYGTCTTAAATVAKTVSAANFRLFKGATISVKFSYANTAANPTMNVNGTGAKRIVDRYTNSEVTWNAGDVLSFVYSGTYWYISDCGSKSQIKQLQDSITLKVSKGDVSSQLSVESGAITIASNRFSWSSTYSSMTKYGALTCTSGKIGGFTISSYSIYNDLMTLSSNGLTLYDTPSGGTKELMGGIGTNNYTGNPNINGLVFDLETQGDYMTWASRMKSSDTSYTYRLLYTRTAFSTYAADSLNVSCRLDVWSESYWHNWTAHDFWFDVESGGADGGKTLTTGSGSSLGTIRLQSPSGTYWDVNVKHGIIC